MVIEFQNQPFSTLFSPQHTCMYINIYNRVIVFNAEINIQIQDHWIHPISKIKNWLHTIWRTRSHVKSKYPLQFINVKFLISSSPYQTLIHIIISVIDGRELTQQEGVLYISFIDRRRGPRITFQNHFERVIRTTVLFLLLLLLFLIYQLHQKVNILRTVINYFEHSFNWLKNFISG